jgi:hypothetical protein
MDENLLITKAKECLIRYFDKHKEKSDNFQLYKDQIYVVWFCKVLSNWKALLSTTINDGMYYEITYNGCKQETYVDAYKKWQNECIPDSELIEQE